MRITVVGRTGINDLSGSVVNQFGFGQVQMNHTGFSPSGLDGLGERFHVFQKGYHFAREALGPAAENAVGLFVGKACG